MQKIHVLVLFWRMLASVDPLMNFRLNYRAHRSTLSGIVVFITCNGFLMNPEEYQHATRESMKKCMFFCNQKIRSINQREIFQ